MARKFTELEAKMSAEAIARSDARYQEMVAEMPLHELRRARGMSQETLAKVLRIRQPNVAKLEKPRYLHFYATRNHRGYGWDS